MAEHVDILKPGTAHPLARVVLYHDHVDVIADDPSYWRDFLEKLVGVNPDELSDVFFSALPERVDGTYVYATQPHEDGDECPVPATRWADASSYAAGV